jgi:cytochrome P450
MDIAGELSRCYRRKIWSTGLEPSPRRGEFLLPPTVSPVLLYGPAGEVPPDITGFREGVSDPAFDAGLVLSVGVGLDATIRGDARHTTKVKTMPRSASSPGSGMQTVQERMRQARQASAEMKVVQRRGVERPPGPTGRSAAVAAVSGKILTLDFMRKFFDEKPISYVGVGNEHMYGLSDPDLVWEVFAHLDGSTSRPRPFQATRIVLGNGIVTSDGDVHKRNRRMVQPAFGPRRIAAYGEQMVAAANRVDRLWVDRVGMGQTQIVVAEEMSALALDVVGRTLFGTDLTQDADEVASALTSVLSVIGILMSPVGGVLTQLPTPTRRRVVAAVERLDSIVEEMIKSKRAALADGLSVEDMLSVLIEARDPDSGERLTDSEIRDEVMTLVLAGYETTANALSWTWLDLSTNVDAKLWVMQEWDSVAKDRDFEAADFASMPRTRAVIAESMRLNPPVWLISRRTEIETSIAGYQVPRGSTYFASQYFMNRDARYWDRPDEYLPRRWINESGEFDEKAPGQPRAAWFPFGFASRKCIGDRFALTEAALVLATLGRKWHVTAIAPSEVEPVAAVTLRPGNGIPARIRLR